MTPDEQNHEAQLREVLHATQNGLIDLRGELGKIEADNAKLRAELAAEREQRATISSRADDLIIRGAKELIAQNERLKADLAAAREDTERLDWLMASFDRDMSYNLGFAPSRAAIDAARKGPQ